MKKGFLTSAFIFLICSVNAQQFKNSASASGMMNGMIGVFDALVFLGLGIGMVALIRDIFFAKNTSIGGRVALYFTAMAIYIILRAVFF